MHILMEQQVIMSVNKFPGTGAGSFIVSHLAERLTGPENKVRVFVHYNSKSRRYY
jgi:hypothetical protein